MLALVRSRRGLITSVEARDGSAEGRLHLVSVEYLDPDGDPEDQLIWEREIGAEVLPPAALPDVASTPPMLPGQLDAVVRATRWSVLTPFLDPDGAAGILEALPVSAPYHGAIQAEDYQLVPLLKALRMPRVSLLLADDVGLGKTIEAGLILTELLLRRRVRRVLIVCPASLRQQWQEELDSKFCLAFDIVDRPATHALQRRLGLDANPWRAYSRIITSFDYLKQADVFERFLSASRVPDGAPHAAWDLLIVDEAHNLAPAPVGEDSEVAKLLRRLSPLFEHRLFLTATPHNGHTRSFTGLLEALDPVRFTRKSEPLTDAEKRRVEDVVIRRLKSEINAATNPPRFAQRTVTAVPLALAPEETRLAQAFHGFRARIREIVAALPRGEQLAGNFAVEILNKRLLSCPATFADSWLRYREGAASEESVDTREIQAAERATAEDSADDLEAESRQRHAARTVGAWLKRFGHQLDVEVAEINDSLARLNLSSKHGERWTPKHDARFHAVEALLKRLLAPADERIVIFTEYKTTLDYVAGRLRESFPEVGAVRELYGDIDPGKRAGVVRAFNDPTDPIRILVATDAASEGLNLQETARYVLHWDVPWNPARLEQRNGRLDRHGQPRDVVVHHFASDDDADLRFLAYVVGKVETIREDLGSTGDVFDRAFERRLVLGDSADAVQQELDRGLLDIRSRPAPPRDATISAARAEQDRLVALAAELDLDPESLRETLEVALRLPGGGALQGPDARGRFQLGDPLPPGWKELVDDTVRRDGPAGRGALRALLFNPQGFVKQLSGRPIFRPDPDTVLVHLGHPLIHRALATLAQARFPGTELSRSATRWTVRQGDVPVGADALLLLTVEELGVNDLRESFHQWVRTIVLPIRKGKLSAPLPHRAATELRAAGTTAPSAARTAVARTLWEEVEPEVKRFLADASAALTKDLRAALEREGAAATKREQERFQQRQGELSRLIEQSTMERLEREIAELRTEVDQGQLFDAGLRVAELARSIERRREELARRTAQFEELREELARERDRILHRILPRRYALRGEGQIFPVAVEIRLPRP